MIYNTHTLPCGLRIIHLPSQSPVVYCGYAIRAGTRDEEPGDEGLAHFCEHVTFKGTRRHTSMSILNSLESVGGELNAFTSKEHTVFYSAILSDHIQRAVALLTDIVFCSIYPQEELTKETAVICDEIESYNDSPADLIFDDFENIIFSGHPLGHNILGTEGRVRTYTTADAARFTSRHYLPEKAVFFVYGNIDFAKIVKIVEHNMATALAERPFRDMPTATTEQPKGTPTLSDSGNGDTQEHGVTIVRSRNTHQAHVVTGCKAYSMTDERRLPLWLLTNILGGSGMNARLNVALRERHGLVYTVESTMLTYSDTGLWATYFGCDHHDVKRCQRLMRREMDRLAQRQLSNTQVDKAKKQIKGQIGIAFDNRESLALSFAKSFLHSGHGKDINLLYERIDGITPSQLQDAAQDIFNPANLTTLIFE